MTMQQNYQANPYFPQQPGTGQPAQPQFVQQPVQPVQQPVQPSVPQVAALPQNTAEQDLNDVVKIAEDEDIYARIEKLAYDEERERLDQAAIEQGAMPAVDMENLTGEGIKTAVDQRALELAQDMPEEYMADPLMHEMIVEAAEASVFEELGLLEELDAPTQ